MLSWIGSSETHSDAGTARLRSVRVFCTNPKSVIFPSLRAGKSAYSAAESGVLINVNSIGRRVTIFEPLKINNATTNGGTLAEIHVRLWIPGHCSSHYFDFR